MGIELDVEIDGNVVTLDANDVDEAAEITSDFVDYILDCDAEQATITVVEVDDDE